MIDYKFVIIIAAINGKGRTNPVAKIASCSFNRGKDIGIGHTGCGITFCLVQLSHLEEIFSSPTINLHINTNVINTKTVIAVKTEYLHGIKGSGVINTFYMANPVFHHQFVNILISGIDKGNDILFAVCRGQDIDIVNASELFQCRLNEPCIDLFGGLGPLAFLNKIDGIGCLGIAFINSGISQTQNHCAARLNGQCLHLVTAAKTINHGINFRLL